MLTQMVPTLDVQILIFAVINLLSLLNDELSEDHLSFGRNIINLFKDSQALICNINLKGRNQLY